MKDEDKTKEQLINELTQLRQHITQLEGLETKRKINNKLHKRAYDELKQKVHEQTGNLLEANDALQSEIIERKRIEEKLRESEERLKVLFDNAPDGYFVVDIKGKFIDGNKVAEKIIGFKKEELIGKNFLKQNLLPLSYLPKAAKHLMKNARGKPAGPEEYVLNLKDSKQVTVEISSVPIKIKGKMLVLGSARDITERKQVEEALRESEEKYRTLVEQSLQGIVIIQFSPLSVIFANPAFSVILGRSYNELTTLTPKEIESIIHPKDQRFVFEQIQGIFKGKPLIIRAVRVFRKDGKIRLLEVFGRRIKYKKKTSIQFSVVDITERKQAEIAIKESETRFRTVAESLGEGLIITDMQDNTLYVNSRMAELSGFSPQEIIGRKAYEIFLPEKEWDAMRRRMRQRSEGKSERYDIQLMQKDKSLFWAEVHATPFRNPKGKIVGTLGAIIDITERKKAEEHISASLKEKEVLLKEIHHRVKNNLQIISSLLSLQAGYIKDKQLIEIFKESQNRIKSMALIHEELYQTKDLSRIDITDYITNLTKQLLYSYQLDQSAIRLKLDIDSVSLNIDTAIPCGLIINELVSNSLKYAFPEEKRGEIQIKLKSDNNHGYVLNINDDGVGFPKEVDIENANSLGLILVEGLTQQIGAALELQSNKEIGTRFKITFKG